MIGEPDDSAIEREYSASTTTPVTRLLVEGLSPWTEYSIHVATVTAKGRTDFGEELLIKTLTEGL